MIYHLVLEILYKPEVQTHQTCRAKYILLAHNLKTLYGKGIYYASGCRNTDLTVWSLTKTLHVNNCQKGVSLLPREGTFLIRREGWGIFHLFF